MRVTPPFACWTRQEKIVASRIHFGEFFLPHSDFPWQKKNKTKKPIYDLPKHSLRFLDFYMMSKERRYSVRYIKRKMTWMKSSANVGSLKEVISWNDGTITMWSIWNFFFRKARKSISWNTCITKELIHLTHYEFSVNLNSVVS